MIKIVQNKKTRGIYQILNKEVINCTNEQDGQVMVFYADGDYLFARELKKFEEKFDTLNIEVVKK